MVKMVNFILCKFNINKIIKVLKCTILFNPSSKKRFRNVSFFYGLDRVNLKMSKFRRLMS